MKDEPEIIKILKEEEKLGILQEKAQGTYENLQMIEKPTDDDADKTCFFADDALQRAENNIELDDIKETYQTIFENYAIGVTLADKNERIISWNKYAEELLNMNEKDLFKIPVSSLYPPEEWKKIRAEDVRKKGIKYRMETKMIRKDKGPFDVELSLCILKGIGGKTVGSVGIIKDITKLKQTERELKESEKRYRTIFENSAVAIMLTDKNEKIISWNRYTETLFGKGKDELFMKPVESLYPAEEWQKIRSENVRQKGMKHSLETKILRKENELLDVDISLSVLKDIDGKIIGSIGVIKDISERKKAEKELKSSEERYRTIFENSAVAITHTDENERIISWNKYAEKLLGMNKNELSLKPVESLYPPEEWKKIRAENIRQKGIQYHLETKIIRKNKEPLDVDISLSVIKDTKGKVTGSIGVIRDISERKEVERRLNSVMEYAGDSIYLIDRNYRYLLVNNELSSRFNLTKEQLLGKNINDLHSPEKAKEFIDKINQVFENGKPIKDEHTREDKKWFLRTLSPVKDYMTGQITAVLVISKDITEIKKTEKVLFENEKKYRTIFELSPEAIVLLDKKGTLLDTNGRIGDWLGYKSEEIIGKNLFKLPFLPEESKVKAKEKFIQRMLGEKIDSYELNFIAKNGKKKIGMIQATPLKDVKGAIATDLVVISDVTENKKMEEEMRIKDSAIASSINAIGIIDLKGNLTYVNNSFLSMWGYKEEENILGKPIVQFWKSKGKYVEVMDALVTKGGWFGELTGKRKDESMFHIQLSANMITDECEKPICMMASFVDITKHKQTIKALSESEEKFRVVLENSLDMIYQLNIKTNTYDYVSPSSLKVIGYSPEEILSFGLKKMNSFVHPDDQKVLKDHFKKLASRNGEEGTIQVLEYRIKHKNLGYHWVSDIRSVIFDEKNEAVAIVGNAKDITEQKKVWGELVKSEEKYRVLAETSADGVFTTDVLGRLTYINPSLERLMGRRKSKILATSFKEYLSESSVYSFQQVMVDIRKNDQKMENIELGITHGEGYEIPVEANIAPLKKEGVFVGIECTVRDVSERERVVRELKKSENLRTEFMNIAAHELKSPVTPIKGYLELIESDKDVDEKIRKWAKIALRNAERLLLLVNDILDVSRLDTDTMRFNMEKIDAVKLVENAAEDIKPTIENKNLKFITEISKGLPEMLADKYRLSQVLKNLLGNAVKFTDYGSITLKAKVEENHLIISVEDSGVGISSGELKKIFTKLYQAYTGEDRKNEGAGLGLYICKKIIKKHKGIIWSESTIGKGSIFTIKLPI